jgi:hypothetical protein
MFSLRIRVCIGLLLLILFALSSCSTTPSKPSLNHRNLYLRGGEKASKKFPLIHDKEKPAKGAILRFPADCIEHLDNSPDDKDMEGLLKSTKSKADYQYYF